jgi:ribulose-phosphate 3-epimerase
MQPNNSFKLAASLICADMLNLEQELRILEQGGIDQIHFDVMDGNFVPRLGLHPEMLQGIRQKTQLPIDVHLMIDKPELYIPLFAKAGADYIVVHAESTKHLDYMIRLIREHGSKAGRTRTQSRHPFWYSR